MEFRTFKYVFKPENEAGDWSLRGDPELWRYLAALLYGVPIPRERDSALQLVKDAITNLTGWDCQETGDENDAFPVNLSLFQNGSGMSTGFASATWWLKDGFPLIARLISQELAEYRRLQAADNT